MTNVVDKAENENVGVSAVIHNFLGEN